MATIALTNTQQRNQFFRQSVLGNLYYWQGWLGDKISDTAALDRERNGLLRAISFALDFDEAWAAVYELIVTLSPYMERRGYLESWHWVLNRALEIAQKKDEFVQLVTLYVFQARILRRQSRFRESVACYRRTIQLARQIGDAFEEGRACTNLGYYFIEQGYWHRAEVLCQHALCLFEQVGSDHGLAHTENHLGLLRVRQRRWAEAQQHLERACAIWETMADEWGLMFGFMNLGTLYIEMERPAESLSWSEKALNQAHRIGETLTVGTIYMNMGLAHRQKGDLSEAEAYHQRAEAIYQKYSNSLGLAKVWHNLGAVYQHQKKWEAANHFLGIALEAYQTLNNKDGEVKAHISIIEYALARKNKSQAETHLNELENLISQFNWTKEQLIFFKDHLAKYRRSLSSITH